LLPLLIVTAPSFLYIIVDDPVLYAAITFLKCAPL